MEAITIPIPPGHLRPGGHIAKIEGIGPEAAVATVVHGSTVAVIKFPVPGAPSDFKTFAVLCPETVSNALRLNREGTQLKVTSGTPREIVVSAGALTVKHMEPSTPLTERPKPPAHSEQAVVADFGSHLQPHLAAGSKEERAFSLEISDGVFRMRSKSSIDGRRTSSKVEHADSFKFNVALPATSVASLKALMPKAEEVRIGVSGGFLYVHDGVMSVFAPLLAETPDHKALDAVFEAERPDRASVDAAALLEEMNANAKVNGMSATSSEKPDLDRVLRLVAKPDGVTVSSGSGGQTDGTAANLMKVPGKTQGELDRLVLATQQRMFAAHVAAASSTGEVVIAMGGADGTVEVQRSEGNVGATSLNQVFMPIAERSVPSPAN